MNGTNGTCFICSWLSMTRRDVVIIDILILLSSASTPLISFVSSLSRSLSLPRSSCGPLLLLPFINPSSFLPLFRVASLFSSACRSYLFFRIPPYSCFLHRRPRSSSSFFILPSVPTPSSFLLLFSSSSFTDLLLFSGFLFFLRHIAYISQ